MTAKSRRAEPDSSSQVEANSQHRTSPQQTSNTEQLNQPATTPNRQPSATGNISAQSNGRTSDEIAPRTASVDPFADGPHHGQRAVRSRWQQLSEVGSRLSSEALHELNGVAQSVSDWTHRTWTNLPNWATERSAQLTISSPSAVKPDHTPPNHTPLNRIGASRVGPSRSDETPTDIAHTDQPDWFNIGALTGQIHKVTLRDGSILHAEVDEPEDWDATQPTIVFSHGYALSRDSWHFQRLALRGKYRMVFWDQRGHGLSRKAVLSHTSIDLLGQDLWEVINATCPTGPVILVGHSMGGMTVMAAAAARPDQLEERVTGVALVATSPSHLRHNNFGWGIAGALAQRATPAALQALAAVPRVTRRTRLAAIAIEEFMVKRYSFASDVPPQVADSVAHMIRDTTVPVLAAFMDKFDDHDKRAALALFNRMETLVLVGDRDVMTPRSYSDRIVRRIPHAEYVVVQQAGHMVAMEHPELVTDHLEDFLRRATQR